MNGVPIETGQANVIIDDPSTYHTFLARVDHRLGDSDNLTVRYYLQRARGQQRDQQLQLRPARSAAART